MKPKLPPPPFVLTVDAVLQHINIRLISLGNKTRSDKNADADRTRAAHGIRELMKLKEWIRTREHSNQNEG